MVFDEGISCRTVTVSYSPDLCRWREESKAGGEKGNLVNRGLELGRGMEENEKREVLQKRGRNEIKKWIGKGRMMRKREKMDMSPE